MNLTNYKSILVIYALVLVAAFVYFVILQQFSFSGLSFVLEGKDRTLTALDIMILLSVIAAGILLALSLVAFGRRQDLRLFILSLAFFFYAMSELLNLMDNFFPGENIYIANAGQALSLLVLLSFMLLMYKAKK